MTHACAHSPTCSLIHHRKSFMSKIQSSGWEVTTRMHTRTHTHRHAPVTTVHCHSGRGRPAAPSPQLFRLGTTPEGAKSRAEFLRLRGNHPDKEGVEGGGKAGNRPPTHPHWKEQRFQRRSRPWETTAHLRSCGSLALPGKQVKASFAGATRQRADCEAGGRRRRSRGLGGARGAMQAIRRAADEREEREFMNVCRGLLPKV